MVVIRELNHDDDLEELIMLSREFFREYEYHHEDFFAIDALNDNHIADYFARWIGDENGVTYIAFDEEEIVGYITVYVKTQPDFWMVKKVGDISGLMIKRSHRRQGVAARLYEASLAFFKEKKVLYFTVFTSVNNRDALCFYEKQKLKPLYMTLMGEI